MITAKGKGFWTRRTFSGEIEYRTSSKVLFTVLPFLLAGLLYWLLVAVEGLERGPDIIVILAYGIGVLLAMLILLVVIISLIEYLHSFE